MNNWLVLFAFPISTIILSITMQKLIKSPILVGANFFAIYLIVAFSAFDAMFVAYALVYAIFAYITAVMTQMVYRFFQSDSRNNQNVSNTNTYKGVNQNINKYKQNNGATAKIRVRVAPRNWRNI